MKAWFENYQRAKNGDVRSLARLISFIENEVQGYEQFLETLHTGNAGLIGITGPPGAGKSTLVDALIPMLTKHNLKMAVLCIDPSSPFHHGALLGDRIRMRQWYNNPNVYIRSLANKGYLGGLHPKIIEITDLLNSLAFDLVLIETVGVGQSEVEVAGLADTTVVVFVPEAGDEIQTMKAGLMEAGDIFVVNKSDRPGADLFIKNLRAMLHVKETEGDVVRVIKTVATENTGVDEVVAAILADLKKASEPDKRLRLLTDKAFHLIQNNKMKRISRRKLSEEIGREYQKGGFNIYRFVRDRSELR